MTQLENRPIAESPNHSMSTVGVVGAGTMGHGIAQVMVRAGHRVLLLDISQDFVEAGAKKVAKGLARDVEKARMTVEEREQALARLVELVLKIRRCHGARRLPPRAIQCASVRRTRQATNRCGNST